MTDDARDHSVVPDFTPVTPDQLNTHWATCPQCHGPGMLSRPCPAGRALWDRFVEQGRRESEKSHQSQAWDLIRAGWRFELPREDSDVMSWWWRSPPRRKGGKGKFHASTNQAWRAMKRGAAELEGDR